MSISQSFRNKTPFPLLGKKYSTYDYTPIDLSVDNASLTEVKNQKDLEKHVSLFRRNQEGKIPWGGYGEKRNLYQSELFQSAVEPRNIHLGIDVWMEEGTPLFAPFRGKVESIKYNDNGLDYGYTLIIKLYKEARGFATYALLGHLSSSVKTLLSIDQSVEQGQQIAHIGGVHENGGWVPHVHFQLMRKLQGNNGDYPGVCKESEKEFYLENCSDPSRIILPRE